ncbi:MAG: formyltetrahydrofolate deformylase [Haloarculaceae archaeon]
MTKYTEVTVVGEDKTGLIARVTSLLFENDINIEDLDQAVREGIFRMTMHVDATEMSCSQADLRSALQDLGDDLGLDIQVRFPSDRDVQGIAVLVTKESHCLETLLDAWANDELGAEIEVVVGNHDDLEPLADHYGLDFYDVGDEKGVPDESELLSILDEYEIDLVVLARYMRILSPEVVFRYEDRIINVHPSLLPSFPGAEAYRQAREEGVRVAGVTAHYVTTDLDQGPIITQRAFNVPDRADVAELERRGQPLEAEALLEAVRLHLDDAISVYHGRTELREETDGQYQLGMPSIVDDVSPDRPLDGLGSAPSQDADD